MASLYAGIRNRTRQQPGPNVAQWRARRVWRNGKQGMWYEATPYVLGWLLSSASLRYGWWLETTCLPPERIVYDA